MTVKKVGDGSHVAAGPDSYNEGSAVTEPQARFRITGDAYDRVQIRGDGVATGDGTAAPTVGTLASLAGGQTIGPGAEVFSGDVAFKSGKPWIDASAFPGWDSTGATGASAAIQAAVNAAIGPGALTTTRQAIASVYIPAGTPKIDVQIDIKSAQGFHLFGAGKNITKLLGTGTLASVINIDGSADSTYEGFSVEGTGIHSIDRAVNLQWSGSGTIGRSTTDNVFRDIKIANGTFVTAGFGIGDQSGALQVDGTKFYNCIVNLSYAVGSGSAAHSQNAWLFGSTTSGNVLDHLMFGCDWVSTRFGVHCAASNVAIYGGQGGSNDYDLLVQGSAHPLVLDGWRSEGSQRLCEYTGGSADCHITLRNIQWNAQAMNADGKFINIGASGVVLLENVTANNAGAGVPIVYAQSAGANPLSVVAIGLATKTAVTSVFSMNAGTRVTSINYHQLVDATNAISTITPLAIWDANTLIMLSRGTLNDASSGGFSAVTGTGYGFSGLGGASGGMFVSGNSLVFRSKAAGATIIIQDSAGTTAMTHTPGVKSVAAAGIGQFGATPPATKPATPVTLADVIALLQSYGMAT